MAWWNASYPNRKAVSLPASGSGYAAGSVVRLTLETHYLIRAGLLRADRMDLRLVYDTGTPVEIDRILTDTGTICFKVQATIPANTASGDYWLYYGNAAETSSPAQDPRNVLPAYLDGADLASLTKTGTVAAYPFPKPGALKLGKNPVITPTPGTGDYNGIRDMDGLFYENGYFYAFYDADDGGTYDGHLGWTTYLARSVDLIRWEKLGEQLAPSAVATGNGHSAGDMQDAATASASVVHKFGGTYYLTYLGSPNLMSWAGASGIPDFPYIAHLATAPSILGPWTKRGTMIPLGGPGSIDSAETADSVIYPSFNGDGTYEAFYGAADAAGRGGVARAVAASPDGPWTKTGAVIDSTVEQIENPRILHDAVRGIYYLFANHIGYVDGDGAYTNEIPIYWSTDRLSWNLLNKTTLLGPDAGAWDSVAIGLPSVPVLRDGMMYVGYDGANRAVFDSDPTYHHRKRSAGFFETPWPWPWGSGVKLASGATAQSASILTGNGTVRVRARLQAGARVGVKGATTSLVVGPDDFYDPLESTTVSALGYSANGGTFWQTGYQRAVNHTKMFDFVRSGSTVTVFCSGWQVGALTSSEVLSLFASGDVVIEDVRVLPATYLDVAVTPFTISAGPIAGGALKLSGSMPAGVTVTSISGPGTIGSVTQIDATSWEAPVSGVASLPATFTATASDGETASVVAAGLIVDAPADLASVVFAFAASGTAVPASEVRAYNDDSGELLVTATADVNGAWAMTIGHA